LRDERSLKCGVETPKAARDGSFEMQTPLGSIATMVKAAGVMVKSPELRWLSRQ
jgi:hypothetical protein